MEVSQDRNLESRTEAEAMEEQYQLASSGLPSPASLLLPSDGMAHRRLDPLASIRNQENAPQTCP